MIIEIDLWDVIDIDALNELVDDQCGYMDDIDYTFKSVTKAGRAVIEVKGEPDINEDDPREDR